MSTFIKPEPADPADPVITETPAPVPAPPSAHPDPITGEAGAHPVGVGVGALGAGAAGAALGSIGGPVGLLIGAAIGAVAGGLAGKEVAATNGTPTSGAEAADVDQPGATAEAALPTPISMGSMPGEGLQALSGAVFAPGADRASTGAVGWTGETVAEPDGGADRTPARAAGFENAPVPEDAPLAGAPVPQSGEEAVRVSAYYHFLEREMTGEPGSAADDWVAAEREMMLG